MSTAELTTETSVSLTWDQICALYPHEWLCLVDILRDEEGVLQAARVVAHDRSIFFVLAQLGSPNPTAGIIHTAGLPLRRQRYGVESYAGRDSI